MRLASALRHVLGKGCRSLLSPAYRSNGSGLAGFLACHSRAWLPREAALAVLSEAKELRPRRDPSLRSGRPQRPSRSFLARQAPDSRFLTRASNSTLTLPSPPVTLTSPRLSRTRAGEGRTRAGMTQATA